MLASLATLSPVCSSGQIVKQVEARPVPWGLEPSGSWGHTNQSTSSESGCALWCLPSLPRAESTQQLSEKTKKEAFQTTEQKQDILTYVTTCLGHLAWLSQQGAERVPPLSLLHKCYVSTLHMCSQLRRRSLWNAVRSTSSCPLSSSAAKPQTLPPVRSLAPAAQSSCTQAQPDDHPSELARPAVSCQ